MSFLPVHARAFIFIVLAFGCGMLFAFVVYGRKWIFIKWTILWTFLTGAAFFSGNIWIFQLITVGVCVRISLKKWHNGLLYYFLLLPLLPFLDSEVPGIIPGIRFLFELTYPRTLSLFILLPLFVSLFLTHYHSQQNFIPYESFLDRPTDKIVALYVLFLCLLAFRAPSFTESLRIMFYVAIDIAIPYYVISRYVRSFEDFQKVFVIIIFTGIMLAFVGFAEEILRWKLYNRLPGVLNIPRSGVALYDTRGAILRVSATMSHPIPFGYFLILVLGAVLFIKDVYHQERWRSFLTVMLLSTALFLTVSRGAFLAGALLFFLHLYLNIQKKRHKLQFASISALVGVVLYVGYSLSSSTVSSFDTYGTFDYRANLITTTMPIIGANPFFGTSDFMKNPEMESLRQGQGIIDVVNTYIQVVLHSGIIGLSLFLLIFITPLSQLNKAVKRTNTEDLREFWLLGNSLIAMLGATMAMLATVSSIDFIPIYYWALIALTSAYIRMIKPYYHPHCLAAISTANRTHYRMHAR